MSSRQSSNSASSSGFSYAAPATYAQSQLDILYSSETSNISNQGVVNGTGSSGTATELLPILPVSVAVATPAGTFGSTGAAVGTSGLTSSGTTATCTLASPHGYANGASGVTVTISTGNTAYNVTNASATITGPYTFTYTTSGSNLAAAGSGTATMQVPAWTATQSQGSANSAAAVLPAGTAASTSNGKPFSSAIPGQSINGQTVGTLEFWADGTQWDTTNNRPVAFTNIDPAIQYKSS